MTGPQAPRNPWAEPSIALEQPVKPYDFRDEAADQVPEKAPRAGRAADRQARRAPAGSYLDLSRTT
jgi:hypothetical protein